MAGDALKSTAKMGPTEKGVRAYLAEEIIKARAEGYVAGLRAFAWWKDGVQYVGTCGHKLDDAIRKGE